MGEEEKKNKQTVEVEAESVSRVVCSYFGIDTKENSWGYIATWSKNKELPELTASMKTIRDTADRFITGIEERMQALHRNRSGEVEIANGQYVDEKEVKASCLSGLSLETGEYAEPTQRL